MEKCIEGKVTPNCRGCSIWMAAIYGGGLFKARIKFRKYGVMKSVHRHLDIMRFQKGNAPRIFRLCLQVDAYPHMIMSLPIRSGLVRDKRREYFDTELTEPTTDAAAERMNATMVEGIEVVNMVEISDDKSVQECPLRRQQIICPCKNQSFSGMTGRKSRHSFDQPQIIPEKKEEEWKEADIKTDRSISLKRDEEIHMVATQWSVEIWNRNCCYAGIFAIFRIECGRNHICTSPSWSVRKYREERITEN